MEILFESEQRDLPEADLLRLRSDDPDYPMKPYAREIVDGVVTHRDDLDDLIAEHAQGWQLDRMPAVDRALLRIGAWEIVHNDEVPGKVAIAEAVELAGDFSTDDSAKFIGGVLGTIREQHEAAEAS